MNRISKFFLPIKAVHVPSANTSAKKSGSELTSKSQKLLINLGLIEQSSNGCFFLLPFAQRSVDKVIKVINEEFADIGAGKISIPCLTQSSLWKKTGRFDENVGELYHVRNRHDKQFIMSPTHEESITHLLSSIPPLSHKQLPLLLYQISSKFRDELKPRFGLIRSNEFLMADLYSFDKSPEAAEETYNHVRTTIKHIFKRLGMFVTEVKGDAGMMGGDCSHELHVLADIGDDSIEHCSTCDYAANKSLGDAHTCNQCKSSNLKEHKGIEVAHSFLLGEKYSKPLTASFRNADNKLVPFVMGSYGIGVSRIISAATEALSTDDGLRWPLPLAPFSVCIIPPKEDKNKTDPMSAVEKVYEAINKIEDLRGDVILDDRTNQTIGKRLLDGKKLGFPVIIVFGKSASEDIPKYELHDVNKDECHYLELPDLLKYLNEKYSSELTPKSVFVHQFV
nr:PREDICTED: probable proline--tRNA ligase, mitochondrial [Bemisia tabaci]XP_018914737.1 PREDICTED: probable proline--tRNA ligase, mitochondrial [Bemisia tabaci]XP_018914746.1 PREDICTED: probable proline--tRNA ligase, mitochondrial [Bemisia tabaci]